MVQFRDHHVTRPWLLLGKGARLVKCVAFKKILQIVMCVACFKKQLLMH